MRAEATIAAMSILFALGPRLATAGETAKPSPPEASITAISQKFVTKHHRADTSAKLQLSFQDAEIHPQDDPGRFAVLGGFMAFGGPQPSAHGYGLTMRQTCPRHDDPDCWALEKLLIDQKLIVDR